MPDSQHLGSRANAILLALSAGERHGYDIMRQVGQDSDGELLLGPATLYTSLKRLLELGLIEETDLRQESAHEAQRRYYKLTASGRASLAAEAKRGERFASIHHKRLA